MGEPLALEGLAGTLPRVRTRFGCWKTCRVMGAYGAWMRSRAHPGAWGVRGPREGFLVTPCCVQWSALPSQPPWMGTFIWVGGIEMGLEARPIAWLASELGLLPG